MTVGGGYGVWREYNLHPNPSLNTNTYFTLSYTHVPTRVFTHCTHTRLLTHARTVIMMSAAINFLRVMMLCYVACCQCTNWLQTYDWYEAHDLICLGVLRLQRDLGYHGCRLCPQTPGTYSVRLRRLSDFAHYHSKSLLFGAKIGPNRSTNSSQRCTNLFYH